MESAGCLYMTHRRFPVRGAAFSFLEGCVYFIMRLESRGGGGSRGLAGWRPRLCCRELSTPGRRRRRRLLSRGLFHRAPWRIGTKATLRKLSSPGWGASPLTVCLPLVPACSSLHARPPPHGRDRRLSAPGNHHHVALSCRSKAGGHCRHRGWQAGGSATGTSRGSLQHPSNMYDRKNGQRAISLAGGDDARLSRCGGKATVSAFLIDKYTLVGMIATEHCTQVAGG